jgi:hypothetical protein
MHSVGWSSADVDEPGAGGVEDTDFREYYSQGRAQLEAPAPPRGSRAGALILSENDWDAPASGLSWPAGRSSRWIVRQHASMPLKTEI